MSSFIYNSCLHRVFESSIHFDVDTFKMILVSSDYTPDINHEKRIDVHGEIPSGNGYMQGGREVSINVKKDSLDNRIDITMGEAVWTNATITAVGAIYYKVGSRGSRTDDLVCFVGFDKEASSTGGSFKVTELILRIQN